MLDKPVYVRRRENSQFCRIDAATRGQYDRKKPPAELMATRLVGAAMRTAAVLAPASTKERNVAVTNLLEI